MAKEQTKIITKPDKPNMVIPPKEKMTLIQVIFGFILLVLFIVGIVIIYICYDKATEPTNWKDEEIYAAGSTLVIAITGLIYSIIMIVKAFVFDRRYVKATKAIDLTAGFIMFFFGAAAALILYFIDKEILTAASKDLMAAGGVIAVVMLGAMISMVAVNLTALIINKKHPKKIWMRPKKEKPIQK